jgi:hypothetical protein
MRRRLARRLAVPVAYGTASLGSGAAFGEALVRSASVLVSVLIATGMAAWVLAMLIRRRWMRNGHW